MKFSAKAIYYIKMFMLLPQLIDRGLFDEVDVSTISRMSKFLILHYEKYFLETALTSSAPPIDLHFWRIAKRYEVIDDDIYKAVEDSINKQMFYLTEDLYVLSLCDEKTTFAEKAEIERALFDTDLRQTLLPKKSFLESHLFKTPLRLKISRLYWRTVLGNI